MHAVLLTSIALAQCPALEPALPHPGAVFAYRMEEFYIHQEIESARPDGVVHFRQYSSRSADPQVHERVGGHETFASFLGILLTVNESRSSFRRRELPDNLIDDVAVLEPGETLRFNIIYDSRLGGDRRRFEAPHAITLLSCGETSTPAGEFQVMRFEVEQVDRRVVQGRDERVESVVRIDYAPALGWPVRIDSDGPGVLELHDVRYE